MKLALFSSIGDDINYFLSYYKNNLSDNCDLYLNYYGNNHEIYVALNENAKFLSNIYTTKFPALKIAFEKTNLSEYDYIFVFDDDFTIETGNILYIPDIMSRYNLEIASGCHSNSGRVSFDLMRFHEGDHIFRYTNFVEMNFPVFSKNALSQYMKVYDGKLCGWGNDWWYLNELQCNYKNNCGIIDKICIKNAHHHEKTSHIDRYMPRDDRHNQWKSVRQKMNLQQWNMQNKEFVYE